MTEKDTYLFCSYLSKLDKTYSSHNIVADWLWRPGYEALVRMLHNFFFFFFWFFKSVCDFPSYSNPSFQLLFLLTWNIAGSYSSVTNDVGS